MGETQVSPLRHGFAVPPPPQGGRLFYVSISGALYSAGSADFFFVVVFLAVVFLAVVFLAAVFLVVAAFLAAGFFAAVFLAGFSFS